jgi:hypothetical protein
VAIRGRLAATQAMDGSTADVPATSPSSTRATITLAAVPAAGAAANPLYLRAAAAPAKRLVAGSTVTGSLTVPGAAEGPASYLAVVWITSSAPNGSLSSSPMVFWLVVPGMHAGVSTPVPSTSQAKATKKPTTKHRKKHPSKPHTAAPSYRIHIVLAGESLWSIAHRTGWAVEAIRRLNPWVSTVGIHPGDALKIPA